MTEERRAKIEAGIAIALNYLREEFPTCNINLVEPEDGTDIDLRTRSFWIDLHGPQRLLFTIQVLADQPPEMVLRYLRKCNLAEYIKNVGRVPVIITTEGPHEMDKR